MYINESLKNLHDLDHAETKYLFINSIKSSLGFSETRSIFLTER